MSETRDERVERGEGGVRSEMRAEREEREEIGNRRDERREREIEGREEIVEGE